MLKRSLTLLLFLSLVACKNMLPAPMVVKPALEADSAGIETAEAAASVSQSLSQLSTMSLNENGMLKRESNDEMPRVLMRLMSIDWSGPVEPLLKQVAQSSHMRLKVLGHQPAIPVLVSLSKRETMTYDILQDIRGQVSAKADIVIFPTSGVIELRYL